MTKYFMGVDTNITIEKMEAFNRATALYIIRNIKTYKVVAVAVTVRFRRRASGYTVKLLHFICFMKNRKKLLAEFVKYLTESYGRNTYGLELKPELYEGNKELEDMGFYLPRGRDNVYYRVIDKEYRMKIEEMREEYQKVREQENEEKLEVLRCPIKETDGKKVSWILRNKRTDVILLRAKTSLVAGKNEMYVYVSVLDMESFYGWLNRILLEIMQEYKDVADKIVVSSEVYRLLEHFVYYEHFYRLPSAVEEYAMDIPDKL